MDFARAMAWSQALVAILEDDERGPEMFVSQWADPSMHRGTCTPCCHARGLLTCSPDTALACFLALRRYARTNAPRDLRTARVIALQLQVPAAPDAAAAPGARFVEHVLRLLHRALWRAYGASARLRGEHLQHAVEVGRRALEIRPFALESGRVEFFEERAHALRESAGSEGAADALAEAVDPWRRGAEPHPGRRAGLYVSQV
jgi:hypothetical protein